MALVPFKSSTAASSAHPSSPTPSKATKRARSDSKTPADCFTEYNTRLADLGPLLKRFDDRVAKTKKLLLDPGCRIADAAAVNAHVNITGKRVNEAVSATRELGPVHRAFADAAHNACDPGGPWASLSAVQTKVSEANYAMTAALVKLDTIATRTGTAMPSLADVLSLAREVGRTLVLVVALEGVRAWVLARDAAEAKRAKASAASSSVDATVARAAAAVLGASAMPLARPLVQVNNIYVDGPAYIKIG
jgi:hypothetical protein